MDLLIYLWFLAVFGNICIAVWWYKWRHRFHSPKLRRPNFWILVGSGIVVGGFNWQYIYLTEAGREKMLEQGPFVSVGILMAHIFASAGFIGFPIQLYADSVLEGIQWLRERSAKRRNQGNGTSK